MGDKHRLGELDALRGIAILMVVFFHLSMPFDNDPSTNNLFRFGITGVDLFFIISGFVIIMTVNNTKTAKDFIINRLTRLYPVYWICLTLSFIVIHIFHYPPPAKDFVQYAVNLSMFQYYFGIPDIEPPYWSLVIELQFYVLIIILYKLKQLHCVEIILFCMILFQMAADTLVHFYPAHPDLKNIVAFEKFFHLIHFLPLFLTGIIFYRMLAVKATPMRYLMIVVCFIQQVLKYSERPVFAAFQVTQWNYGIVLAIFILLFFLFVNRRLQFIVNKITLFLGRISYTLYLFHQNIIFFLLMPFFQNNMSFSYLFSSVLSLIIVISTAGLITVFLDEPIRRKIKKARKLIVRD